MKKYIDVTAKQREAVLRAIKVSGRMLRYALSYDPQYGHSDTARQLRKTALEQGGVERYDVTCEEVFFDSAGNLRQLFRNGAELLIEKSTGAARVLYRGKTVITAESVRISEVEALQNAARNL